MIQILLLGNAQLLGLSGPLFLCLLCRDDLQVLGGQGECRRPEGKMSLHPQLVLLSWLLGSLEALGVSTVEADG